jgi:hypothetical protein
MTYEMLEVKISDPNDVFNQTLNRHLRDAHLVHNEARGADLCVFEVAMDFGARE